MSTPHASLRTVRALGLAALLCLPQAAAGTGWISLFDGRSLDGWRVSEHPASFQVTNGTIAAVGPRAHLFYDGPAAGGRFKNFEFVAEVLTRPGANSGIFFHTRFQGEGWPDIGYEAQINNTQPTTGGYHEFRKTGSLYGVRNVYRSPVGDNEWFTLRIRVEGKHIRIWVNDVLTVDYREPAEPLREGRRQGRVLGAGTFALQCHDPGSLAFFRNLRVRLLPDDLPEEPGAIPLPQDTYVQLKRLHAGNFPVIDLHGHLKGGLTPEDVLDRSRATGIGYGLAVNGGIGFPVTNDAGLHAFADSLVGQPVFVGLQAEGREWPTLFSQAALDRFDYVFTDAMTITDHRGRRTRLWIPAEVEIDDPDAFMERLVGQIETILATEPVDLYANPTFLPEVLAGDYDRLWTVDRMDRVIAAAVRHQVAIEINDRYRIPKAAFIKRAKAAGARFTFGTNNGGADDLGHLAYALEMIRECGLEAADLFVPGETPRRPMPALRSAAPTAAPGRFLAYVGTYTGPASRGIYGFRHDPLTGSLEALGCVAETSNPSFIAFHPTRPFLYAVGETGRFQGRPTGLVSAFAIDPATGGLTLLNQVSSGGAGPCHLSVDHSGRVVLVANYSGGSVAALPIQPDGRLGDPVSIRQHEGSSVHPTRQRQPHAHAIQPAPDNRFVLATDLGIDQLLIYRLNPEAATLVPHDPPHVALPPGSGPRHFAFHPNGRQVFVLNELLSTLASFAYDPAAGVLTPVDSRSTLPDGYPDANTTAEVQVHPSGRFVYASNRGHDSIALFAVEADGRLQPLGQTATGGRHPRNFGIDPAGRTLWVANRDSNQIVVFRVEAESGRLVPAGQVLEVPTPVCVRFYPLE